MVMAGRLMTRRCWLRCCCTPTRWGSALRGGSSAGVSRMSRFGCWRGIWPDHVTICRFRLEHQDALAGLFGQVLGLCARAGIVQVGILAVDGAGDAANASRHASVDYEQLARTILEEAAEVDAAEDEQFGDRRGDELPEQLTTRHGRQAWLRQARQELEEQRARDAPADIARAARQIARGQASNG